MNRVLKKRVLRLEQAAQSHLPLLPPIVRIAQDEEDAARQKAELEASGALVSPDGRRIPLYMYVVVRPKPW